MLMIWQTKSLKSYNVKTKVSRYRSNIFLTFLLIKIRDRMNTILEKLFKICPKWDYPSGVAVYLRTPNLKMSHQFRWLPHNRAKMTAARDLMPQTGCWKSMIKSMEVSTISHRQFSFYYLFIGPPSIIDVLLFFYLMQQSLPCVTWFQNNFGYGAFYAASP